MSILGLIDTYNYRWMALSAARFDSEEDSSKQRAKSWRPIDETYNRRVVNLQAVPSNCAATNRNHSKG